MAASVPPPDVLFARAPRWYSGPAVRSAFAAQLTEIERQLEQTLREVPSALALVAAADGSAARRSVAMRHVLIARSIERIGDNALGIARQAAFVVAGSPAMAATAGSDS
jgi:phosphate uptake regulator